MGMQEESLELRTGVCVVGVLRRKHGVQNPHGKDKSQAWALSKCCAISMAFRNPHGKKASQSIVAISAARELR